jgi:hypothetical protein
MKFEGARARNFVGQKKIVPNLMFFGSQEAVKKFGPKIGFSMHRKLLTERNTHC